MHRSSAPHITFKVMTDCTCWHDKENQERCHRCAASAASNAAARVWLTELKFPGAHNAHALSA
jgi:hypothetical protein